MKTFGRVILWAACAVLLSAPSRAEDAKKGSAAQMPIAGMDGTSPHSGCFPGSVNGAGMMSQGMTNQAMNSGGFGPWGARGPDAETAAKLKKAEELEKKTVDMGVKLRDADPASQPAAKAELRKTVGELFDVKLAIAESIQQAAEKRAAALKARLEKRKAAREEFINKKVDRIAGDDDDWD
jgi:hypothetical protein